MFKLLEYYSRFQGFRGNVGGLPGWARAILVIVAMPAAILVGLSVAALVISIAALLLLVLPTYRLLTALVGSRGAPGGEPEAVEVKDGVFVEQPPVHSAKRRQIDVTIIE